MITMFLGGLWHGASWTFVAWGALHGLALAAHRIVRDARGKRGGTRAERGSGRYGAAGKAGSWALTFLFLLVTWVLFRSPDFGTAWTMLRRMAFLDGTGGIAWVYVQGTVALGLGLVAHLWSVRHGDRSPELDLARPLAWPALAMLLLAMVLFAPAGRSPFIYLQF